MTVGAEEQVVGSGTGIVRIARIGVAVIAGGNVREIIGQVLDTDAALVLPSLELVQIRPRRTAGAIGLGGDFLVEVVVVDDEILRHAVAGLVHGQDRVVIYDVEGHMAGTGETGVLHYRDGNGLIDRRPVAGIRIFRNPGNVAGYLPGPVRQDLDGKTGRGLRHRSLTEADDDGRETQVLFLFLAGLDHRKR